MADIPGPHVKFTGDADGLKKAAAEGDKAVEQFAKRTEAEVKKATKASERSLDGFNKRIHLLGSELKGTPATAKLHEIALAVERIGGHQACDAAGVLRLWHESPAIGAVFARDFRIDAPVGIQVRGGFPQVRFGRRNRIRN